MSIRPEKLAPNYKRSISFCKVLFTLCLVLWTSLLIAQVQLTADRPDATYAPGETANFVLTSSSSGTATYSIIYDNFAEVISTGTISVVGYIPINIPYTHTEPGLVLCKVNLNGINTIAAAAYALDEIQPLAAAPADFDAFWDGAKADLAGVDIDPQLSDCEVSTYETTCRINLGNIDGRRVYGYISVPSTPGPYPAILTLPPFGAGPNVCTPEDDNAIRGGALSISINIHDVEPDVSDPNAYEPNVITNPDSLYYKYAVLGAIRAIDYIFSRSDFNGTEMGVMGFSQGGGLSYLVAGIDERVNLLLTSVAALSEHNGLIDEKASGSPYYIYKSQSENGTPAHEVATANAVSYYDAMHAAARYDGPAWSFIGYEDLICPAATGMVAYNQLAGPKIMTHSVEVAHNTAAPYWNDRYEFFKRHYPSTQNPPWPWTSSDQGFFINAGSDTITDIADSLNLSATVEYNTTVDPNWPREWKMISGPGTVTFSNENDYQSTATFSMPGTYLLQFSAYDYTELESNKRFTSVADQLLVEVNDNNLPPEVMLSTANTEVNGPFSVDVQFSKIITGLEITDFILTNNTITNISGAGSQYTLAVTPTIEGSVSVLLPADVVEDNNGNLNLTSNLLSVNYVIPQGLFLTCPEDFILNTAPGASTIIANWAEPTATTTCADQEISIAQDADNDYGNGDEFPIGTIVVNYTATDNCNNEVVCDFNVIVNAAPVNMSLSNCQVDTLILIEEGLGGQTLNWTAPIASTNCYLGSNITVDQTAGLISGSFLPVGINTITYLLTDLCGTTVFCSFNIEIAESPGTVSIDCLEDIVIVLGQGEVAIPVSWELPITSSNCANTAINPNCGTIPNSFTFMGSSNNHEYLISDNSATWPVAEAACNVYVAHLVTIDNAAENAFIQANISSTVMIGVNDGVTENSLEWSDEVTPLDYTNFPNTNVNTADKDYGTFQSWDGKWGLVNASVWKRYVMEFDCESIPAITLTQVGGPAPGSVLTIGTYQITYQAEDGCGDVEICSFNVVIEENTQTISMDCPESITVYEEAGTSGAVVNFADATASTTCADNTITIAQPVGLVSGSLFPLGATTVSFEATDNCGSINTCSFLVNVVATPAPLDPIAFSEMMGANTRIQYPNDRLWVVGSIRDYYPWVLSEGFPAYTNGGNSSPGYPNNRYKFNSAYQSQGYKDLDLHYDEIAAQGLVLNTSMLQSVPHIVDPLLLPNSNNAVATLEQKPVYPGNSTTDPFSYMAHADWMYHFTARYGSTAFSANRISSIITPKLELSETALTGLGQLQYIENWNEPDKWWYNSSFPAANFTAYEYAAMTSADYDGHMQTMSLVNDPDNPGQQISTVGARNADPNVKFVLAGLANLNTNYLDSMRVWFDANRTANATHGLYPFDVLNFHHYSYLPIDGGIGVSPEQDYLRDRLETLVDYRDQNFPGKEVWLSEFGYDTDMISNRRIPENGFGDYDQREVQGQWIIRSFLEISAAGIDRAHLFEFRDACTGDECSTYQSSGIVESAYNNYKPKKSWYYVATLKSVMEGMEFDADISPTCATADTICLTECARVYRFVDPNNPTEKVFAVWSPSSCGKAPFTYTLDLEGATAANIYELEVLSTVGKKSLVTGTSIDIAVSERPVFIKVGTTTPVVTVPCLNSITITLQTCSTLKLNWDATVEASTTQVWYQEGHLASVDDFDINTALLAIDDYDVSNGSYLLTGLNLNTDYSLIILSSDAEGNTSDPCLYLTNTLDITCTIPIDPVWIFDSNDPVNPPIELFDEQGMYDPFCGNTAAPLTSFGITFSNNGPEFVSIDLQKYYDLNAIALYDFSAIGLLTIEYAISPNGPWLLLTNYMTNSFRTWVYLDNLLPSNTPVRYLRITASNDNEAVVNEMYICGTEIPFDDSVIPPGEALNLDGSNLSCNSADLSWDAPFDDDILHYQVTYSPNPMEDTFYVLPTSNQLNLTIVDLEIETTYTFEVITIDNDNNEATPVTISEVTNDEASCNSDCDNDCPCFLCLNPAWLTDMTPASGLDPLALIDEQEIINPFCGAGANPQTEWGSSWGSGGIPPMIAVLDLQVCHLLNSIQLFDGSGIGVFRIEYQDIDGNWTLLEDYTTSLWEEWYEITDLNIETRYLRFTKLDDSARINEIALCGQSLGLADCGQTITDEDNDGYTNVEGDCDDTDPAINPGATEICDGIDNNCDGITDVDAPGGSAWYADIDMDGFGDANNSMISCLQPLGFIADDTDCDDNNVNVNPDAIEICDGLDNNCNGIIDDNVVYTDYYPDADGDGYGDANADPTSYCVAPPDSVINNLDCDDSLPMVNPGMDEICEDGLDNNCNGEIDEDNIPPTITCMDISVNLDNGIASIDPTDVFASGSDNCNSITLVDVSPSSFTAEELGENVVVLTATDNSNNITTCEVIVTVDQGATAYCASSASSPWVEYISRVQLNDIDNTSGKDGYGDFTYETTIVVKGTNPNLTITPTFSWAYFDEYVQVWIDFNQDFDFNDPGELVLQEVLISGSPNYPPTASPFIDRPIAIPASALSGSTRMRISMSRNTYATACENFVEGEVEDYTLDISESENLVAQEGDVLFFDAKQFGREVFLDWVVNTSYKTDRFILEHAVNGIDFDKLASIANTQNTSENRRFDYRDKEAVEGSNYYRLRQLLDNGTEKISRVRRIDFSLDVATFTLFPVPAEAEIFAALGKYSGEAADLKVYNSYGQSMFQQYVGELPEEPFKVDVAGWPSGVYHLTVKLEGQRRMTRRFMVVR
ncbi:MAG: cephalosporin-C deacetylase-like acetyl esterase [Flavobacteriales bacterium]|jgi:cephalosporin-C deacetylase-like acetyl esterase